MSGDMFPNLGHETNIPPPQAGFGAMRDVGLDVPNLSSEIRNYPGKGPVTVDTGDEQADITGKLRLNSLADGAPLNYKKGSPMFHYRGKNAHSSIPNRYFAITLQNMNEYMVRTAIYEARRLAQLKSKSFPDWNERFFDMLYKPTASIFPLGAMWTNDEGPEIRQREVTMLVAGQLTFAPNHHNIFNAEAQFLGHAIKLIPRSFTYSADNEKIEMGAVEMKIRGKTRMVHTYAPQFVPIVENGNRGPCFCSDLDDIAKPATERMNKELTFEAPRIYQRPPRLVGEKYEEHAAAVLAFNQQNGGDSARPPDTGIDADTDFDEMAIHEAPYFRFGQVLLTTQPLMAPQKTYSLNPISLSERSILTWEADIKMRKTSNLLLSVCRNPAYEWKK